MNKNAWEYDFNTVIMIHISEALTLPTEPQKLTLEVLDPTASPPGTLDPLTRPRSSSRPNRPVSQ